MEQKPDREVGLFVWIALWMVEAIRTPASLENAIGLVPQGLGRGQRNSDKKRVRYQPCFASRPRTSVG
jgi:hypothetical protein